MYSCCFALLLENFFQLQSSKCSLIPRPPFNPPKGKGGLVNIVHPHTKCLNLFSMPIEAAVFAVPTPKPIHIWILALLFNKIAINSTDIICTYTQGKYNPWSFYYSSDNWPHLWLVVEVNKEHTLKWLIKFADFIQQTLIPQLFDLYNLPDSSIPSFHFGTPLSFTFVSFTFFFFLTLKHVSWYPLPFAFQSLK